MQNECSECNASLETNQTKCAYCGTTRQNFDEQLLVELAAIKRKYELAFSRGNKLIAAPLLADEYTYILSDGGVVEEPRNKNAVLSSAGLDTNFNSYNIYNEELLERTADRVVISCVQNTVRRTPYDGEFTSYISRTKLTFVYREGRWQIAAEDCISIDEYGEVIL
ncbi:MAG: nuclear transport factor 2 family protein [Pyrinomonadaceae bacterium]|nr:nuclear transport factor 2 family protein [Pyrinomonadaceae bacterium]